MFVCIIAHQAKLIAQKFFTTFVLLRSSGSGGISYSDQWIVVGGESRWVAAVKDSFNIPAGVR